MGRDKMIQGIHGSSKKPQRSPPIAETRPVPDDVNPPARNRARNGKGMHILPPSDSDLNGCLQFTKKKDKERYKKIRDKDIIPCKYIDRHTMEILHIDRNVLELIDNIGWCTYFSIQYPAYIELVREFYTTFEFKKPDDFTLNSPRVVQFRLMGKDFKLSIIDFNLAFGFIDKEYSEIEEYLNSACDSSEDFEPVSLNRTLSTSNFYHPSKSKDSFLRDPALKYIHKFLAFTFSGRKDSSAVLSKSEFYFLWCMLNKIKVNLGYWLASQFANVLTNKHPLILGSLITHLAIHENLIDPINNNLHVSCEMQPLDLHCLEIMVLLWKDGSTYKFHESGPIAPRVTRTLPTTINSERAIIPYHSSASTSTGPATGHYDGRFDRLEHRLARMERNQNAFFAHMGFTPPLPPSIS